MRSIEANEANEASQGDRNYTPGIIDAAFAKARAVPREAALIRVSRQSNTNRPVFVVSYNPQLPNIEKIVQKHYRSMVAQDQYLQEVFEQPPIVAYKRNKNIKETLIRAKLTKKTVREKRQVPGMKPCRNTRCKTCPFVKEGRSIKSKKFTWKINKQFNCTSRNVIYMLECNKSNCGKRYIGETDREIKKRINEHLGYIRNKNTDKATGKHFNLPGHSESNLMFTIIEQSKSKESEYRKEREKYHISKFNTYYQGINREP